MIDWKKIVREHLADSGLSAEKENEVVEELSHLLEDASRDERLDAGSPGAVEAFLRREVPEWGTLKKKLRPRRENTAAAAVAPVPVVGARPERGSFLSGLGMDLRVAWRLVVRNPGFTAVVVLTLALGVGLNSSIFSLVNYLLLRPLPVESPEELVQVYSREPGGFIPEEPMSYPDYRDVRETVRSLQDALAWAGTILVIEGDVEPQIVIGGLVSGNYFETLGVGPFRGRLLDENDDRRGSAARVIVLSHSTWQTLYGGSDEAIGSELRVNGHALTVIGVAPPDFKGTWPVIEPAGWLPVTLSSELGAFAMNSSGTASEGIDSFDDRSLRWLWVVGRLAPGTGIEKADAELATLGVNLQAAYPDTNEDRELFAMRADQVRIVPAVDSGMRTGSVLLMSVVGLVLLIATANVANMLLARALARRGEIATRLSLGGSRGRLLRQFLLESLMLAGLGAGAGLWLAAMSNAALNRLALPTPVPLRLDLALDFRVVAFTGGLVTLAALVFGLVPALEAMKTDIGLSSRTQAGVGRGRTQRMQELLVVSQVCFSVALLVCAGLTTRSIRNVNRIDPGFALQGVMTATLDPELQGYDEDESMVLYERLRRALRALPGVDSVGSASHLPLSLAMNTGSMVPQGQEGIPEREQPEVDVASVGGGYFEAMGIPILQGRTFSEQDTPDKPRVAVVNRTLADRFWPGETAIGRRIVDGDRTYEVVGIARNGKYRTLGESPRPFLYRSIDQTRASMRVLVVRFERLDLASAEVVRRAIRSDAPHLAISNLVSLEEAVTAAFLLPRYGARLFGLFGFLGLFLAAVGLYGVLAYAVTRRTHEIGLRMAIGARPADILHMILRQGITLTLLGALLGLPLVFGMTRLLGGILYGVSGTDPLTLGAVVLVLLVAALIACVVPARRAAGVAPVEALRCE